MRRFLFTVLIFLASGPAGQAAVPAPAVQAPAVRAPSTPKFNIHAKGTDWLASPQQGSPTFTRYMAPQSLYSVRPSLTLRFDQLSPTQNLNTYAKKYLADYPRLGLKVLRHQQVRVGSRLAYLVDLADTKSSKQLRQVLLAHNKQVAVLTCRAHQKAFKSVLSSCHRIIKNFKWGSASPSTTQ